MDTLSPHLSYPSRHCLRESYKDRQVSSMNFLISPSPISPSPPFVLAMTKPSSKSCDDASVEVDPRITRIKIDIVLEHGGSPGDILSLHEGFFEALDGKQW